MTKGKEVSTPCAHFFSFCFFCCLFSFLDLYLCLFLGGQVRTQTLQCFLASPMLWLYWVYSAVPLLHVVDVRRAVERARVDPFLSLRLCVFMFVRGYLI